MNLLLDGRRDFEGERFVDEHLDSETLESLSFEDCVFERCSFHEAKLFGCMFDDCRWLDCDLSNATLTDCVFASAHFERCKLLGVDWTRVRRLRFQVRAVDTELSYSSFAGMQLKGFSARGSKLRFVDWTEANLDGVVFDHCDLHNAHFARTQLRKTDFGSSVGVGLDVSVNRLEKTRICLEDALRIAAMQGFEIAELDNPER